MLGTSGVTAQARTNSRAEFLGLLREYGDATRRAVTAFLPNREPRRYLYDLLGDYPRRGGRFMRPAIHIATAKAHGASVEQAMATAVSIEMLHNALLVIDDIQDESEERRGAPTLHRQHGVPIALNVGSTLSVLSLAPLLRNVATAGPHIAHWIFEEAIRVAQSCAEGQAMELGWRADNRIDVTEEEYLDMVLRKTCAYSTLFPVKAGVMVGRHRRDVPVSAQRYAYLVGAAFQIQDDVLNLAGDHQQYGKELQGDLLEGKRTLITIALLDRCSAAERKRIASFMGTPRAQKTDADLAWLVDLIKAYDCIDYARRKLNGLVGAAEHECQMAFGALPESRDKTFLFELPRWVIEQS